VQLEEIPQLSKEVFDPRRFIAGKRIELFLGDFPANPWS